MRRIRLRGLHLLVLALALASNAAQARRVAIIIANESYASEARLYNPLRDANAIAAALGPQGAKFDQVLVLRDLTLKGMRRALQTITATSDADALIVYYSGHGMRDGFRRNFLLPVDAQISKPDDIAAEGIDAEDLVTAVRAAQPKLGLIVLDACRNNPFYQALGTKGTMKGLERRGGDGLNGVLVAYAADGGQTADDGRPGTGSPFATAFARRIATPGTPLLALLDDISDEVASVTQGRQVPTRDGNLRVSAMLVPAVLPPPRPTPAVVAAPDLEREAWDLCKAASVAGPCRAYLDGWGKGTYASLARIKVDSLTSPIIDGKTSVETERGASFVPASGGSTFVATGATSVPISGSLTSMSAGHGSTFVPTNGQTAFSPVESFYKVFARNAVSAVPQNLWSIGTAEQIFGSFLAANGSLPGLLELANAVDRDAMTLLAYSLLYGSGGQRRNTFEALRWLRLAVSFGQAAAQQELGQIYESGIFGIQKNESEASRLYLLSAKQGNAKAQNNLGSLLFHGNRILSKNTSQALFWWKSAADQGLAVAHFNLGLAYFKGIGVKIDRQTAVRFFKRASSGGDASGQVSLGACYQFGEGGLQKDRASAIFWYRKAATQGDALAIANLKRLGVTP